MGLGVWGGLGSWGNEPEVTEINLTTSSQSAESFDFNVEFVAPAFQDINCVTVQYKSTVNG